MQNYWDTSSFNLRNLQFNVRNALLSQRYLGYAKKINLPSTFGEKFQARSREISIPRENSGELKNTASRYVGVEHFARQFEFYSQLRAGCGEHIVESGQSRLARLLRLFTEVLAT